MNERLDIEALRALLAVAEQGGVTRAAEHLGLSQPAVSHKIRRMEEALGCKLLARRAGGPLLTEEGERLLIYAQRMSDLHDEAVAALGQRPLSGALRLGLTEDVTASQLTRIMGRFARVHPNVQLRTRISQSLTLQAWLEAGEIDLAVMQIFQSDLHEHDVVLLEDNLHWIKSPDLELEAGAPVPLVAFDDQCFYKHWALKEGARAGLPFVTALECPSTAGVLAAVRAGLGVALMNGRHLDDGLERVEGLFPAPPSIAYVARGGRRNAVAKALAEAIGREITPDMPLRFVG